MQTLGMTPFHKKLKRLIDESGLSQAEIARRLTEMGLDATQGTISNWTRDKSRPDIYQAAALAEMLGVTLEYLAYDQLDVPSARQAFPFQPPAKSRPKLSPLRPTGGDAPPRRRKASGSSN